MFSGSKYPKNILFNFENRSIGGNGYICGGFAQVSLDPCYEKPDIFDWEFELTQTHNAASALDRA